MPLQSTVIRRLFKYSSFIINPVEKKLVSKNYTEHPENQTVFIIGPPRSGSTILYQILTNYLDVIYVNNFVNLARETPMTGFYLADKLLPAKPHNSFKSNFGLTEKNNFLAPNEGTFWYKWLQADSHYADEKTFSHRQTDGFRRTMNAILNKYKKPFLIKNLGFSLKIRLLETIFDRPKYIYIKRKPLFVAQSILLARKKLNIPAHKIWSIRPQNFKEIEKYDEIKLVARQIYEIEKQINTDKKIIDDTRFAEISYEKLCEQTQDTFYQLKNFINANEKIKFDITSLKNSNQIRLDQQTLEKLEKELNLLYGKQ